MGGDRLNRRRRTDRERTRTLDPLEHRCLLTGGGGSTFAVISEEIAESDATALVDFTIAPGLFQSPRGQMVLGIDVVDGDSEALVEPEILAVRDANGTELTALTDPNLSRFPPSLASAPETPEGIEIRARLFEVDVPRRGNNEPISYQLEVGAGEDQSGRILSGFYLPGDATGDGQVNSADLLTIYGGLNTRLGDQGYEFSADANRDAVISFADVLIARQNLGVTTLVQPTIVAQYDPASDTGPDDRITTNVNAIFTGSGSPLTEVTFTEIYSGTVHTPVVADRLGLFEATIGLNEGPNMFRITGTDPFGQSFNGLLAPITLDPDDPASLAEPDDQPQTGPGGRELPSWFVNRAERNRDRTAAN